MAPPCKAPAPTAPTPITKSDLNDEYWAFPKVWEFLFGNIQRLHIFWMWESGWEVLGFDWLMALSMASMPREKYWAEPAFSRVSSSWTAPVPCRNDVDVHVNGRYSWLSLSWILAFQKHEHLTSYCHWLTFFLGICPSPNTRLWKW